ncbi:MAG: ADP-ribosyltransferase, partial [Actinomycetota bacterium]|nr:ADP-ribosyltransferase [Actinomycetota bacterium]
MDTIQLAQDHMQKQVMDAAAIQAGLSYAFDKQLKPNNLDASFPTYLRSALALVAAGRSKAHATAVNYYGEAKTGAGFERTIPMLQAPALDIMAATQNLLSEGPISIKKQLASGDGLMAAMAKAKAQTLSVGKRLTLESSRATLINLSNKDKDAQGWSRVSDGQPCHFCAMLLSRGPVYGEQSGKFRAHNGCGCSVRPYFKGEAHGGWSPDALALRNLWDGVDEHGNELPGRTKGNTLTVNEWRSFYGGAVNDPSSKVFDTFTDKVAIHISSPAVVAARQSAQAAYDAQRETQKLAEKAAKEAEDSGALKAAQEAAKLAAAEAAKIKKWQGKPAPKKPVEPVPASTLGEAAFDPWLAAVKARFTAFANSTGNPKNDLTKSLNWNSVQAVIKSHDKVALDSLKSMHYIDDVLHAEALAAMKAADAPIPGAADAYKKELSAYKRRLNTYKKGLVDWREINGVTSELKGMDAGKVFTSDHEAIAWAGQKLKIAEGVNRTAIKTYTGSSYRPWNDALRSQADADKLPEGTYKTKTKQADAGFGPAPEDFIVHRGTGWDEFLMGDGTRTRSIPPPPPESLIGSVQVQHGYSSTSMGTSSAFGGSVALKLMVPEGHGVSWAMPYSNFSNERELLLERGTKLFVHDVYQKG